MRITDDNNENMLTVSQAAQIAGLTEARLYQLLKQNQLRAIRLHGKAWLIPESEARRLSTPSPIGRPRKRKAKRRKTRGG